MTCNCQFHQQGDYLHVLVKGKGMTTDNLDVQIQRRRLTVILNKETLVEGLLHGQVDVGNCKVKIYSDYAEIKLRKEESAEWPQLLLGVPDMMTSLQRAQAQTAMANNSSERSATHAATSMLVSPEASPMRNKSISIAPSPKTVMAGVETLNMSLSNLVHKVFDSPEMRDEMAVNV